MTVGFRLLTRTFRLLQVVQPLELPGIPTMLGQYRVGWARLASPPRTLESRYEEQSNNFVTLSRLRTVETP